MNKEERVLFTELNRCLIQIKNEHPDLYNIKLMLDDVLKGRIDFAWEDLAVFTKEYSPTWLRQMSRYQSQRKS